MAAQWPPTPVLYMQQPPSTPSAGHRRSFASCTIIMRDVKGFFQQGMCAF